MNADLAALLYLAAGVLFILALRGLSSPVTSRRGNFLGMTGMAVAGHHARGGAGNAAHLGYDHRGHCHRRQHRCHGCAPDSHDGDA